MKTLLFIVSILSILDIQSYSQNLAPNGFFEYRDTCPYDMGQVRLSQGWQPASGTPDFFNCTFRGIVVSTLPNQGDGYMCFYGGKQAAIEWYYYTENSKAKLLSPLKKGRKYRVNFYCGLDLFGIKDSFLDFGIYFFSGKLIPDSAKIGFFYKPQLRVNMKELPIHSYNFYDFCFQADRDCDSILIGPFANSYSNLMPNSAMSNYYIMLDDLEIIPNDTFDFKADKTVICDSGFVNFNIQNFNSSNQYFWILPGSTIDSMHNYAARPVFYNKPGRYPVSLIVFGNCNDTLIKNGYIEVISRSTKIDLVPDNNIVLCKSEKYTIRSAFNRKVIWNNGAISDSLNVTESGKYKCKFYTGCDTIYDTIIVDFHPRIDFKADKTTFCDSGVVNYTILNPNNTFTCMWQFDGGMPSNSRIENPENIRYSKEGRFEVTLIVDRPCPDTIKKSQLIQVTKKLIDRDLVEPQFIEKCDYETIEVKTNNNVPVKWSNGQISSSIQVTKAGKYSCSYINFCDTINDTFIVNFRPECPCEAFFPNSFSPNNDQFNDYFSLNGYAENINLNIYNRVGEKVFSSTDKKFKWDGKYKGELVPSGVFIYTLSYKNCLREEKFKTGSVNVLY